MGTRYEDQPPEHWAGPESLDPTPVWKQFLAVGLLALTALAIIAIVSLFALAPQLATPPALVPGDRLVLARSELPAVRQQPVRIGAGLIPDDRAVWIAQVAEREYVAVSAYWTHPDTGARCPVIAGATPEGVRWHAGAGCDSAWTFAARGEPDAAPRGLDRYLVSVDGDRVIVNLSRPIRGFGKTPQPTRSPL
ncbi:MAG TPA: hypothetical protein VFW12_00545 [Candidatus Limnocylindria bacterium]|nr:hypothetical protein [Candidatus Limnocylindria bacterium]